MHICCAIFFAIHWNSLCSQHSPLLVHFTFGTDEHVKASGDANGGRLNWADAKRSWFSQPGSLQTGGQVGAGGNIYSHMVVS